MTSRVLKGVILALVLCCGLTGCERDIPTPARSYTLTPPFDVAALRAAEGRRDLKDFECKDSPKPQADLFFESMYDEASENSSIVDPDAHQRYRDKTKSIRALESGLGRMANRYILSNPPEPVIARCVMRWLVDWSKEDALLGQSNHMGDFVRKWALTSIALAYIQVRDEPRIAEKDHDRVKLWIATLANRVIADFSTRTDKKSRNNNHMYWAAWGVTAAGIALDDPLIFNWGLDRGSEGIADIQADGSLPLELARGPKAFMYHNYAAIPLFMMANTAKKNGRDLYAENNKGLARLARLILANIDDQHFFVEKTGEVQNIERAVTRSNLTWLEPYFVETHDANALPYLVGYRPLKHSRVGGDATLLYGFQLIQDTEE